MSKTGMKKAIDSIFKIAKEYDWNKNENGNGIEDELLAAAIIAESNYEIAKSINNLAETINNIRV